MPSSIAYLGLIGLAIAGLYLIVDAVRRILSKSDTAGNPIVERWIDRYNGFDMLRVGAGLIVLAAIIYFSFK